jgi:transcriptional regulator with XRE-family HTH domain
MNDPSTRPAVPKDREKESCEVVGHGTGSARLGTYLRRLREGYGYTLRRVEEQAVALGEAIDNSQLSRFEKGKAVPSFEKLRALARVFNVPIQNFSDVLDLEEHEYLKPESSDFEELLKSGSEKMSRGEYGQAFVTYERALEVTFADGDGPQLEKMAEARWRMACALKSLGKLYMAELELREILKRRHELSPKTRLHSLLQLGFLYRELGDLYLASVLLAECLVLARELGDRATEVGVLNGLGNIHDADGSAERAVASYREALGIVETLEGRREMQATVTTNLGGGLVGAGQFEEGVSLLQSVYAKAKKEGLRRVAALAQTRLAEAWDQKGDSEQARKHLASSDTLASDPEGPFHDILFLNAYHRWQMVRREGNSTGERIAFGRLRHIRSVLQRRFREVDEFDRHVERIRR